jgi:hypothetical protein
VLGGAANLPVLLLTGLATNTVKHPFSALIAAGGGSNCFGRVACQYCLLAPR